MDIEKLRKQADWTIMEKRCPWKTLTSMELSKVLGVTIVDINNWRIRGKLPALEPRRKGQGNVNRWRLGVIRSWLESRPESEIHWEFINNHMDKNLPDLETAMLFASKYWNIYDLDKPSRY